MKTKTKKTPFDKPLPGFKETTEETIEREVTEAKVENKSRKERFQLSFDLNEDGTPDLAGMRESTKEKVKQFFGDSRMAASFGTRVSTPEVQVFHPMMIGGLYDLIGSIEQAAVTKWFEIPQPIAKKVFAYTPEEKAALEGPTVRVLNKYAAEWMVKYQDEITLATILTGITIAKFNAARVLTKMYSSTTQEIPSQEKSEENVKKEGVM